MAILLVGALIAGWGSGGARTDQERARAIEASVKCPICRSQSVETSETQISIDIRTEIRREIDQGRSDDQIRSALAVKYGEDIQLNPPASGLAGLVWVLPVAAFIVAIGGLALAFRQWRGPVTASASAADTELVASALPRGAPFGSRAVTAPARASAHLDPDELAALEEQRQFLLRSLDDLEAEKDAGDLDDADYEALKDDYTARAAEVLRALDEQRQAFAQARRPQKRGRLVAIAAAVLVVALGAGFLVANTSGQRRPGDTISGGVTTAPGASGPSTGIQDCITAFQGKAPVEGIKCFDRLIKANPADGSAYTYRGWLLWNVGNQGGQPELVASAKGDLAKAVEVEPKLVDPHIFLAIIANREGDNATAGAELDRVDALGGPPQGMDPLVNQLRSSVAAGGAAPDGGTTTTAPPAPTSGP